MSSLYLPPRSPYPNEILSAVFPKVGIIVLVLFFICLSIWFLDRIINKSGRSLGVFTEISFMAFKVGLILLNIIIGVAYGLDSLERIKNRLMPRPFNFKIPPIPNHWCLLLIFIFLSIILFYISKIEFKLLKKLKNM